MKYETVIGLEVHVQLDTATKIFCSCPNKFGAAPNTNVCPVCLGMPGSLPVFNKKALEHSISIACALECEVQNIMKFDRKNYYYPDLPKNYQISQFDMPLAFNGKIEIDLEDGTKKIIGITRAHMEEDAGKLLHSSSGYTQVDLNRTGTPLLEIVSEPDMTSPYEAYEYLTNLKSIIKYLGVSDCNMEEGSLRCDANISLKPEGQKEFGTKVEIKNLNSFKAVREALSYEVERQRDKLKDGETIIQETRLWDENKCITTSMRSKEGSHDYRYFTDPDLVPFEISKELVKNKKRSLPELPKDKRIRFQKEYDLTLADTNVIIAEKEIADFFEQTSKISKDPKKTSNWVKGEIMMHLKDKNVSIAELTLTPEYLAEVISLVSSGKVSNLVAKEILDETISTGKRPNAIMKDKGLEQVSNEGELEKIVDEVIAANAQSVKDLKTGKQNALSFLIGQVMKLSKGKANPKVAGDMLRNKLS
ncbi:MAG: Asp-tRNA(Asn)/Glu-tRNA(Gln) amidotransferase subunit GatB [Candidatus Omnitrophica bacterium]|nr:Asp-tRNA(Asn)/Glu-tRNA(Gln) amidotransferase subunit GatB [Candidatus Omnitrophota bacterium]